MADLNVNSIIKKPKVALLLCGYLRSWETCLPSFLNYMKDIDYDVFIHTYETIKDYHPYIRDTCNIKDNNHTLSQSDIENCIKIPYNKLVIEDVTESLSEIKSVEQQDLQCYQWSNYGPYDDLQVLKGKGISIRTYLQYRKLRLCNELRKLYQKETGVEYDYIIKLRMDLDYSKIPSSLIDLLKNVNSGKVLTSASNCQPNDHIYICLPDDMDKLISSLGSATFPLNREYNPHEYLFTGLSGAQLSYIPIIHNLNVIRN